MKLLPSIMLWSAFTMGCQDRQKDPLETDLELSTESSITSMPTSVEHEYDLATFEMPVSMYNKQYKIKIEPKLVEQNQVEWQIYLTSKNDTIFSNAVTIDTMHDRLQRLSNLDHKMDLSNLRNEYLVTRTDLHGIRNKNLYFESKLQSLTSDSVRFVLFQINYLERAGELFVNGIAKQPEAWGRNMGEAIREKQMQK